MYGKKEKGMHSMGPGKPMMSNKLMKPAAAKKMSTKSKTAAKTVMPKRKAM